MMVHHKFPSRLAELYALRRPTRDCRDGKFRSRWHTPSSRSKIVTRLIAGACLVLDQQKNSGVTRFPRQPIQTSSHRRASSITIVALRLPCYVIGNAWVIERQFRVRDISKSSDEISVEYQRGRRFEYLSRNSPTTRPQLLMTFAWFSRLVLDLLE